LDTENFEEFGRDEKPAQPFAAAAVCGIDEIDGPPSVAGHGLERLRLSLPIDEIRGRCGSPEHSVRRIRRTEHHQAIRIRVRQRMRQHRITDAEDCGVRADTDGKTQHRNGC
jgi:hypothetical protein